MVAEKKAVAASAARAAATATVAEAKAEADGKPGNGGQQWPLFGALTVSEILEVECPVGCATGDKIVVTGPDGRDFTVAVPGGVTAGQLFTVERSQPAAATAAHVLTAKQEVVDATARPCMTLRELAERLAAVGLTRWGGQEAAEQRMNQYKAEVEAAAKRAAAKAGRDQTVAEARVAELETKVAPLACSLSPTIVSDPKHTTVIVRRPPDRVDGDGEQSHTGGRRRRHCRVGRRGRASPLRGQSSGCKGSPC